MCECVAPGYPFVNADPTYYVANQGYPEPSSGISTGWKSMSDHLLIGLAPTAPQGRELFFHSYDTWLDLSFVIIGVMLENERVDRQTSEGTKKLAEYLRTALKNGDAEAFFRKIAKESFTGRGCKKEREMYVENMCTRMEDLIEFLIHSGGMRSV